MSFHVKGFYLHYFREQKAHSYDRKEIEMARYREVPCKYYIALGECKKRQGSLSQNILSALWKI